MNDNVVTKHIRKEMFEMLKREGFVGTAARSANDGTPFPLVADLHLARSGSITVGLYWGCTSVPLRDFLKGDWNRLILAEAWQYWMLGEERERAWSAALRYSEGETDGAQALCNRMSIIESTLEILLKMMRHVTSVEELKALVAVNKAKPWTL